ncbi:MAG: carbamoyltransferase HypF, partial [Polyangiaceae bacterium]|nr:carbamoyltransferase HypF [Polyangiaceae bacterium]
MTASDSAPVARLVVEVRGAVQGVGFRPFVYRLATELGLAGFVQNGPEGVVVDVEGAPARLAELLRRLPEEAPPHAELSSVTHASAVPVGQRGFEIRPSARAGDKRVRLLPDLATCAACLAEVRSPADRRHRYAFTNCTHCGPRFSIVERLPYDRAGTTMRRFEMCAACRAEYASPADRRFHAQPNACPQCGPELELWDGAGRSTARAYAALEAAAAALGAGAILALKGLGGFQLLVRADDAEAVRRLRARKRREEKPFALMAPTLEALATLCECSAAERTLVASAAAPIVLLGRRPGADVAAEVAPGNPWLGIMLPYTPLHHLLCGAVGVPLVATSGNSSDEPICIDEHEALARLGAIADLYLVHDRPIARPVDDSVARVVAGRPMLLRRARGYAPFSVALPAAPAEPVLALGAHLKSTVALGARGQAFGSQHVGDLDGVRARAVFAATARDLPALYEVVPARVACDAHPDYHSTRVAEEMALPVTRVQHHHAHVRACMLDHELEGRVLGVAWDGTGLGDDGTSWGGELLLVDDAHAPGWRRVGHLATFRLPGGDAAARQPWRSALGVLFELDGPGACDHPAFASLGVVTPAAARLLVDALGRGLHAPRTSSAGRLFDAASALLGLGATASFEGQAAMRLEFAVAPGVE